MTPMTFTFWETLPGHTDLMFYEGLHGGVATPEADEARHADPLVGVESMLVIRFANPKGIAFQYLRNMIPDSFMSRANTIVVKQPSALAFDLVMFDLDGTLIATAAELAGALNDTLAGLDMPVAEQAKVERWIGHGTRELLVQALAWAGKTSADAVRASSALVAALGEFDLHYCNRCGTSSRPYPRVHEVLQDLRHHAIKLAVVTNKDARYTRLLLDAHQLTGLLDLVVSGDTLPTRKPDPGGILHCLAQFGVPPDRALFVGDSSVDVATARNAGVRVWAMSYGYNMGQPISDSKPDRVLQAFEELTSARRARRLR